MASARLEQLLQLLKLTPEEPFVLFALAKEYEKSGNQQDAFNYYNQLVTKSPDYVGTYYHLGKWYEKQEQFSEAFFTYKKGMEVARKANDQHSLSELAGAKLNLGDDEDFE